MIKKNNDWFNPRQFYFNFYLFIFCFRFIRSSFFSINIYALLFDVIYDVVYSLCIYIYLFFYKPCYPLEGEENHKRIYGCMSTCVARQLFSDLLHLEGHKLTCALISDLSFVYVVYFVDSYIFFFKQFVSIIMGFNVIFILLTFLLLFLLLYILYSFYCLLLTGLCCLAVSCQVRGFVCRFVFIDYHNLTSL